MSDHALADELEALRTQNERLAERVADLEAQQPPEADTDSQTIDRLHNENETLRQENDRLDTRVTDLEAHVETLESRLADCESETTRLDRATQAAHRRGATLKESVAELQARELEKGAHLHDSNVEPTELDVAGDRVERITKDDGTYVRLPEQRDPLERGGTTTLAHGDLLPIQQLARMDDDMLRSTTNALPTRLAAQLWNARTDETVGDDPWRTGSKAVRASVKASDLKHWIRRQEPGTSESYAKKLVSRTIDALLELSKNRLAVHRRKERKNGLKYTERRIVLPADAEIPGETSSTDAGPETAGVHG
ncbi:hypothetical protein [Saliphagus infecundisoli]|uniref:Uncharacterized protein n=1 Tax=Saliphagus infecundisoli TaxID=1849069 RepID=A0ABD5QKM6_9EURY|nr:hypothetical protein [Saliphagus infecundisoli]